MSSRIILDVSRLLSRAARLVPTGIDRVEHAYADGLERMVHDRLRYAAVHPLGRFSHLPTGRARNFIDEIGNEWSHATPVGEKQGCTAKAMARKLQSGMMMPHVKPRFLQQGRNEPRPTYLLVSHHHLHQPEMIQVAQKRLGAAFVCFIHDLIPIEYPEYGRPREAAKHRRRIQTAARLADACVVNSEATREALAPYIRAAGRNVPLLVAPLGIGPARPRAPVTQSDRPYFLYIATIEPRKNHLLLFNVWRRLVLDMGEETPRLILVGQRGWENEMVLDVLERSELLREHLVEYNALPDEQVQNLIAGAKAVLLPSFAEGYGLPVAEALAAGTPVLCSDLPALREVGGLAPEYLDPLDGLGWLKAIRDYIEPKSPLRQRQLQRIAAWSPPAWQGHVEAVVDLIDSLPQA